MSRVSCFGRLQHPTKRKEDLDNAAHACPVVGGPDGSDEIVAVVDEGRGQPRRPNVCGGDALIGTAKHAEHVRREGKSEG